MKIAVVIPARDEEALLPRCLASVTVAAARARRRTGVTVEVIVVADRCTDATVQAAQHGGARALEVDHGAVGAARRDGVTFALMAFESDWIANTDADSVVPPNWLDEQVRLARKGTDVVIGTVRPDPADLSTEQLARWRSTRVSGVPNGHVHGANLGVRVSTYLAAGGFTTLPEHEDVDLVARCSALGAVVVPTAAIDVTTSGRSESRAPGGYSRYLHDELFA